jgi:hypothetical protein
MRTALKRDDFATNLGRTVVFGALAVTVVTSVANHFWLGAGLLSRFWDCS